MLSRVHQGANLLSIETELVALIANSTVKVTKRAIEIEVHSVVVQYSFNHDCNALEPKGNGQGSAQDIGRKTRMGLVLSSCMYKHLI
jgi:hypothetical protein